MKELRKEKGITQEQFAEILGVSGRTVSRWETGNNMPDISLLINIALSDYANAEKETIIKNIRMHSILGTGAMAICMILELTKAVSANKVFEMIFVYAETLVYVAMVMILVHTTGLLTKIRKSNEKFKGIPKGVLMVVGAIVAFVIAGVMKSFLDMVGF